MTTPERIRRRQMRIGAGVLLLGLATIGEGVYFHRQDQEQKACFADKFSAFSSTMQTRGNLSTQEFRLIRHTIDNAFSATSVEEFRRVKSRYFRAGARIDRRREANPILTFPEGTCD